MAHEFARQNLKKTAVCQKRNYDKKLAGKPFQVGDSVWLHQVRRKKGRNPKLDCPWEGPYLVTAVLSDVVYRIQRTQRARPKVVHSDRLKPYLGPPLKSWISPQVSSSLSEPGVSHSVAAPKRMVVDERVTTSIEGESSVNHFNTDSNVLGDELEGREDDRVTEQVDSLQNTKVITDCGNTELGVGVTAGMTVRKDQLPETLMEEAQEGQHRRKVKAPDRFGEWVTALRTE